MPRAPAYSRPGAVVAHRHRHVGVPRRDAELGEQPAQRRVGPVVVDEERRVDSDDVPVAVVDVVGVCVPAQSNVCLEQRHPVARRQHVGRGEAGDPAADDGDRASEMVFAFHAFYSEPSSSRMGRARVASTRTLRSLPMMTATVFRNGTIWTGTSEPTTDALLVVDGSSRVSARPPPGWPARIPGLSRSISTAAS